MSFQTRPRITSRASESDSSSVLCVSASISSLQQSTVRSLGLVSQQSQSASEEELLAAPLTSGNWSLDQALETHLDICCVLLQVQASVTLKHTQ